MQEREVPLPEPIEPALFAVLRQIERAAPSALLVGGVVRSLLLGMRPRDVDLASQDARATAEALAADFGASLVPLGGPHELFRVPLHGEGASEIDITEYQDLEEDALRREATVSALFARFPASRDRLSVVDACGGLEDIAARVLRAPRLDAYAADPVRVMRLARLAEGLGFTIHEASARAAAREAHRLPSAAPERTRDELARMFKIERSAAALRRLDALGGLAPVLPELEAARACEQPREHYYNVFDHSLAAVGIADWLLDGVALDHTPDAWREFFWDLTAWFPLREYLEEEPVERRPRRALLKFGCLLHDIAKPQTRGFDEGGRMRFLGHAKEGAQVAARIARRLRLASSEAALLAMLVREHLRPNQIGSGAPPTARAIRRLIADAGDGYPELLVLTLCDGMATVGPRPGYDFEGHARYVNALLYRKYGPEHREPPPILDGHAVMAALGIGSGPMVGAVLSSVREAQLDGQLDTREDALEFARRAYEELSGAG